MLNFNSSNDVKVLHWAPELMKSEKELNSPLLDTFHLNALSFVEAIFLKQLLKFPG